MSLLCRCRYNSEQVVGLVDDYEQRFTWRAPVMGPSSTHQTPEEATTHRKQRLLTQKQWFTWCAQLLWAQVSTKTSHLAPEGSNDDSSETATTHLASSCFGPK